ncbi:hypothetical protein L6452_15616 [Arctium lappa]|uniref:Uncharacterized protein n=1 Tax=Arctium lappa TaxID=4217 RepID=A0ACB9CPH8_ARCLA|nr:hypothetical protein L6452_15616 [Arctium lappa]
MTETLMLVYHLIGLDLKSSSHHVEARIMSDSDDHNPPLLRPTASEVNNYDRVEDFNSDIVPFQSLPSLPNVNNGGLFSASTTTTIFGCMSAPLTTNSAFGEFEIDLASPMSELYVMFWGGEMGGGSDGGRLTSKFN